MNKLHFYGTDFSPIDSRLVVGENHIGENVLSIEQQKNILTKFIIEHNVISADLVNHSCSNRFFYLTTNFRGNDNLYFDGVVGVLSDYLEIRKSEIFDDIGDDDEILTLKITLQIQSRFDGEKPYFLSKMLQQSNAIFNDNSVPSNYQDFLFDFLLLFSFKEKLNKAYLKGYYKTYHRFENNDDRVRGNIDVARHIQMNMGLKNGKIAYSYRDNTIDNFLNHLIVAAYCKLKEKHYELVNRYFDFNPELKGIIEGLRSKIEFHSYDIKTLIIKNISPISHPYYTEYEDLRKICLQILRDEGVSIFNGYDDDIEGVLHYLPDLWENYVEKFLNNEAYFMCAQEEIRVFDYNEGHYKQLTRPDYVFYFDSSKNIPFMILDAKFKKKWDCVFSRSSISGVLEDYNKCIRDMNTFNTNATGVIFPSNDIRALTPEEYLSHGISKYNQLDRFYTFPIYVPLSDNYVDYKSWNEAFENIMDNASNIVHTHIIDEMRRKTEIIEFQRNHMIAD